MLYLTVPQALICRLKAATTAEQVKELGDFMLLVPLHSDHVLLAQAWREATANVGLGAPTHPSNEAYRLHHARYVEAVADYIKSEASVLA